MTLLGLGGPPEVRWAPISGWIFASWSKGRVVARTVHCFRGFFLCKVTPSDGDFDACNAIDDRDSLEVRYDSVQESLVPEVICKEQEIESRRAISPVVYLAKEDEDELILQ